jgi:hypothetical protein
MKNFFRALREAIYIVGIWLLILGVMYVIGFTYAFFHGTVLSL